MTNVRDRLKASTTASTDPIKASFRNFVWVIWKHLGLPEPTPIQYDIAQFLQHGPRRIVIEAFRGVGKSWITAAYVCWLLYCNPDHKIMVVSASKVRADDFSTFCLRLIREVPILRHLEPREGQRESKIAFDVGPSKADQSPSLKSVGITGQLAGSRADTIVADDIEIPNNSDTQGKRDALSEAIKEFDAVLKPGGRVVYLGTPQTEQSIYNELPKRGYVIRVWPARFPTEKGRAAYGGTLAPYITTKLDEDPDIVGKSTEPRRFSEEDLAEREMSYGKSGFALQFMLDTALSDADKFPLKLRDLIIYPLDPSRAPVDMMWAADPDNILNVPTVGLQGDRFYRAAWISKDVAPYEGTAMFIDPSGRGRDETAYAIVRQLHGRLFLVAIGGYRNGYDDETLTALMKAASKHGVTKIIVEPNYGGGMFAQLLKAKAQVEYPVSIEDAEWSKAQKEMRIIDTLEPVMNQHRLVVCPSVIEEDYRSATSYSEERPIEYSLFWQMARITRDRGSLPHDDRLDALEGAVAYWLRSMGKNTRTAAQEHRDRLFDEQLRRHLEIAIGRQSGSQGRKWASQTLRNTHRVGGRG